MGRIQQQEANGKFEKYEQIHLIVTHNGKHLLAVGNFSFQVIVLLEERRTKMGEKPENVKTV